MKRFITINCFSLLLIAITAALLSVLSFSLSLPAEPGRSSDEEQERVQYRYRFRPAKQFSLTGTPPYTDAKGHGQAQLSDAELKANQNKVKEYVEGVRKSGRSLTKQDVVEIYHRAQDFKVVHSLLGNFITVEESVAIGKVRQEILDEAIENITRKKRFGDKLGVNDFGSGAKNVNAKTDIDFTLFSEDGKFSGDEMVAALKEAFTSVTRKYGRALDPGQMDIVAHRYEAAIPDWRQSMSSADFAVKLRRGIGLLRANPEAYFLEGAYLQQVMGRSTKPETETFSWLSLGKDGKVWREKLNAAQVAEFFYHPDVRARYAWGGAVGNWHFYHAHSTDKVAQAKYILRSIDDGIGLLLEPGVKKGEYEKLTEGERAALVKRIYGDRFTPESVEMIKAVLDTARNMRKLKGKDIETVKGKLEAYQPIIDYERKRLLKDSPLKVSDEDLLLLAIDRYERTSKIVLVENNIRTARARLKDWLAPKLLTSDIPEKNLHAYDENGNSREIKVDRDMVTRLNYSAFFELKDAISLMDDAQIRQIQADNPAYHNDIEILKRLINKQKEMMTAPDGIDDPVGYREKAVQEITQDITRLQEVLKTKGRSAAFIETGKTLWNRGNEFENWLQRATVDKVVSVAGGKQYLPVLWKLRKSVDVANERYLGPTWMTRLDRGTSLLEVLKAYTREGKVNEQVLLTAIYEGLSYVPGIGTLYALQGGVQGVATLTFVQIIPGYGQILLVVNFAKGVVELGGLMIFEPLKHDKILLAYQGYLDPEKGGIITSGQRERVESPRPPLLYPVDPDGKLPIAERREKMYHYLHESVLSSMKKDSDIWFEEREFPLKWREKEFEHLTRVVDQYVEDWWNGTGVFSQFDVLTVHRGPDIRAELEGMLKKDYVTGKNIAIQQEIQKREARRNALMAGIGEVAGMDIALDKEGEGLRGDYRLAGEVIQAYALDEMPVVEPSVEIIAAPRIKSEKHPDPRKKEELDISEDLNLRAKIHGSLKTNPGPWTVKWEVKPVSGGSVEYSEGKAEKMMKGQEPFTEGGMMRVTAYAIDGNGKKFAEGSIEINIEKIRIDLPAKEEEAKKKEKERTEEAKKKAAEGLDKLAGASNRAKATANEVEALCNQAKQKAAEVKSEIETLRKDAAELKKRIKAVQVRLSGIKEKAKKARAHADEAAKAGQRVVELKQRVETLAVEPCRWAEAAASSEAGEGERRLSQRAQKAMSEIGRLRVQADRALRKAKAEAAKAEAIFNDVRSIPEELEALKGRLDGVQARLAAQRTAFNDAGDLAARAADRVAEVKRIQAEVAGLAAETQKELQPIRGTDDAKQLIGEMNAKVGQVASVAQKIANCPDEVKAVLGPLGTKLAGVESDLKGSAAALDQAAVLAPAKGLVEQIEAAAKDARASADTAEVFFEGLQQFAADASTCGKAAQEAAARRADTLAGQAKAAIQACEFQEAKELISQMPAGPKRSGLQQAYEAAHKHEETTKALAGEARGAYKSCRYAGALDKLEQALRHTRCARSRDRLGERIATVKAAQQGEETSKALLAEAAGLSGACSDKEAFERALSKLKEAEEHTRCEERRGRIREAIAKVGKTQANEEKARALFQEAKSDRNSCDFDAALAKLSQAVQQSQCEKRQADLREKIATVKDAKARREQAGTLAREGDAAYKKCEYDAALSKLEAASDRTSCEEHRGRIRDAIAKVEMAKAHEEQTRSIQSEAKALYAQGENEQALARLEQASDHTRCAKNRDKLGDMIAKVKAKSREGRRAPHVEPTIVPPAASDTRPFIAVFQLHLPMPTSEPQTRTAPLDADEATKRRIKEDNKRILQAFANSLTLSNSPIRPVGDLQKNPSVLRFSGDGVKAYPRASFRQGEKFSLPITGNFTDDTGRRVPFNAATLLTAAETFDGFDQLRMAYPNFKMSGPNVLGQGGEINDRTGTFRINDPKASFSAGPLTKGWTPENRQKSLELTKLVVVITGGMFNCFIANAVYGDRGERELAILRRFRDEILFESDAGARLVHLYYAYGPILAKKVREHPVGVPVVRWLLDRAVFVLERADMNHPLVRKVVDTTVVLADTFFSTMFSDQSARGWASSFGPPYRMGLVPAGAAALR